MEYFRLCPHTLRSVIVDAAFSQMKTKLRSVDLPGMNALGLRYGEGYKRISAAKCQCLKSEWGEKKICDEEHWSDR